MTAHSIGTREEWLAEEKALIRRSDGKCSYYI